MSENPQPTEQVVDTNERSTILTRREFTTLLIGSGMTLAMAAFLSEPITPAVARMLEAQKAADERSKHNRHWVMVIDLSKCIGCDYCVFACQAVNDTTEEMRWNIRIDDETDTGKVFYVTRPCLHCRNAPCVEVCPVSATYHREDGLVVTDYNKCIGCRYCQVACPYGARVFNWVDRGNDHNSLATNWGHPEVPRRPRGVIEKCTFCIHRIDAGLARGQTPGVDPEATPACVNICPVNARHFGDINNPDSPVARIIASKPTLRLREDLGTEPSVYYIPPEGLA
jgi:Fe-S-cluster-containing dehydrogenase component